MTQRSKESLQHKIFQSILEYCGKSGCNIVIDKIMRRGSASFVFCVFSAISGCGLLYRISLKIVD